jgi:MoaA/NifB/PqqE/SkfB family radical SAM enzyme
MCDIWKTTGVREISAGDLERHLPAIERLGVKWVVLSGGEPLMHSDLWRLTAILRARQIRITLLSSGLLLRRYAEAIVDSINDVIVSLDGPAEIHNQIRGVPRAFESTAAGIGRIRRLDAGFQISARCTVQRTNFQHLVDTVNAAHLLDLNSISFLAADVDSVAFNRPNAWPVAKRAAVGLTRGEVALLEVEIERLISRGECGRFVREPAAKLWRIAHHFRAVLGEAPHVAPVCNAPWKSAVVEADGAVRPCFFHRPIGHLSSGRSLEEILNGPDAIAFRDSLDPENNPTCQRCVCSLNWKQDL